MDANGFVKPVQGPLAVTYTAINCSGQSDSNVPNKKEHFLLLFHSKKCQFHPANGAKLGSWPAGTLTALAAHFPGPTQAICSAFKSKLAKLFGE